MAKDKGKKTEKATSKKKAEPVEETKGKKSKKAAPAEPEKKAKGGKKSGGGKGGIQAPGSGGNFKADKHVDHLLLITPKSVREDMVTDNGTVDAIEADIIDLTTDEVIKNGLIFQKVVQGQLREALESGGRVCGTLFVDEASKKKGQSAPYKLAEPSAKDLKKAQAFLDKLDPLR